MLDHDLVHSQKHCTQVATYLFLLLDYQKTRRIDSFFPINITREESVYIGIECLNAPLDLLLKKRRRRKTWHPATEII